MNIQYPTGETRQFYERNSLSRMNAFLLTGVAPHILTVRSTYTVPPNRRAVLTSGWIKQFRATAAAPVGFMQSGLYASINGVVSQVLEIDNIDNAIGPRYIVSSPFQVWLNAADIITLRTRDTSTGGTMDFSGSFSYMEFDA